MLEIRFRVISRNITGSVEFKKTITAPHPAGVTFAFETGIEHFGQVEIRPKPEHTKWLHDEQCFEVVHFAGYSHEVWEGAGFVRVLK